MECEKIQPFLDGFAEGELSSSQVETIEEHLEGCASCRKELSAIRRTVGLLKELGEVDEPGDFVQQVRKRIELSRRSSLALRLLGGGALRRVLVPAVSVMIAGLGIWMAYRHFSSPPKRVEEAKAEDDSGSTRIARIDRTSDSPRVESTESDDFDSLRLGKRGRGVSLNEEITAKGERTLPETVPAVIAALPDNGREKALLDIEGEMLAKSGPEGAFRDPTAQVPASATVPRTPVSAPEDAGAALRSPRGAAKSGGRPAEESSRFLGGTGVVTVDDSNGYVRSRMSESEDGRKRAEAEEIFAGARLLKQQPATSGQDSVASRGEEVSAQWGNGMHHDAKPGVPKKPSPESTTAPTTEDYLRMKTAARRSGFSMGEVEEQTQRETAGDFALQQVDFEPLEDGDPTRLFATFSRWSLTRKAGQADSDSDSSELGILFPDLRANIVKYDAKVNASPPELVLYVKDRAKALEEIRKMIGGLGGKIEETEERVREEKQHEKEEDAVLTVMLKPGTYGRLRGEMIEKNSSDAFGVKVGEGLAAAGGDSAEVGGITTLRIRLIEVTQEKPTPNSPQE